ncbi:hypothetical protein HID58_041732 [Brassica napus]|uniref:Uncharacterized protein n=1 Tax=Brassica napus TaxID=3708 RepID=A0ABQ8BBQ6_BRANA|nr:hypothetical protein HID58_041732 [Brassica napus]
MISRRWDPSIIVEDWFGTDVQGYTPDGWKWGFILDQLGIDLGINKEILGRLRKLKIWFEWSLIPIIIKTESRPSSGQPRADQVQKIPPEEAREEGEIKNTGEDDTLLPSLEFQLELAKTHAGGTEVIVESTDEDKGLQLCGVDMEAEEEFQTLSEEEVEQAEHTSRAQEEQVRTQGEEEVVPGEADIEKGTWAGDLALKQGSRKRLFKPSINTAGSTKMRMASAHVSPRRKAAAKVGPRHGEGSKPPERYEEGSWEDHYGV